MTNLSDLIIDLHSTTHQAKLQWYGNQNPVQLEPNYYKTFAKEYDVEFELKELEHQKFICSLSCIQQMCMVLSDCSE